ncbi:MULTISPECIES: ABC transporter substrate-binding protein [unclassified Neorhizobium]|uniref:ABC transporter substrate-binding protein n=1 Tax=unclassified Neorhizobium TaxID=2629175 RepID=UPI001FF55590|nr:MULTISPECIES: ABC transporter substrate-binding protein [unclassified Neorhizobium]MCJ9669938.1 ABC transporter substrate-binding protein [Neorhizobium sp. SHOUNA12B]MCJ9744755.1 ABC transporter substrate-binding protein [Neorhizobium sp. SHOUNA12A]
MPLRRIVLPVQAGKLQSTLRAATVAFFITGIMSADFAEAGTITITCGACQESPSDPFLQYNFEAAQRFNEKNKGKYHVETLQNQYANSGGPDRLQYYKRLALAGDLPDIFLLNASEIKELQQTGKLRDFANDLAARSAWRDSFLKNVFSALSSDGGHIWAIPQQRDAIGIFYNKALLASVGYSNFPETWEDFEDAAEKLRASGKIAIAMDGGWSTLLMWTNMIGTHPDGKAFLEVGIKTAEAYTANQAVVIATETLRRWHTKGYVNVDAFSGEFQNAASVYMSGEAAMIANGPWMVNTQIKTNAAAAGLYEETGYAPSPGWKEAMRGAAVVTGAGWSSGHTAHDTGAEAVLAFLEFLSSPNEQLVQARETGARPAVKVDREIMQSSNLEPLGAKLGELADTLPFTYPHWRVHAPGGFLEAWKNLWPAYAKGEMDTPTFLQRLANASSGKRG